MDFFHLQKNNSKLEELKKSYNTHHQGKIIIGPSCIGKTTFLKSQTGFKKDWIDTDDIMKYLDVDWHYNEENLKQCELNYRICDFYLAQLKLQGFWILGSLFWEYTPDAIVIPKWKEHKKMLKKRIEERIEEKKKNKINFIWKMSFQDIKEYRTLLKKLAKQRKIPIYNSVIKAVSK
jgi:guanylate kinase